MNASAHVIAIDEEEEEQKKKYGTVRYGIDDSEDRNRSVLFYGNI